MKQIKLLYILGTRPEVIKLAPLILTSKNDGQLGTVVCHTGQHKELASSALDTFGIKPEYDLALMKAEQSLSSQVAKLLSKLETVIQNEQPQLVIVQGDTSSALAGAMAAFYQQIPVAHIEAGLRSKIKTDPFPEEINRRLISQFAELHFCPTNSNLENLNIEAVTGSKYVTGNTGLDAVALIQSRMEKTPPLSEVGSLLEMDELIIITIHRRENQGVKLEQILAALKTLSEKYQDKNFLFFLHPNPVIKEVITAYLADSKIQLLEPVSFTSMIRLLTKASLLITDSGGLQEESTFIGCPTIIVRQTTERQEAVDAGLALLTAPETESIVTAVGQVLDDATVRQQMAKKSKVFGNGSASESILNHIKKFVSKHPDK